MSAEHGNHGPAVAPWQALAEAIRFLTIIPVPGLPTENERSLVTAIPWFPLVGLLLGAVLAALGALAGLAWDAVARAALLVVAWGILTGGLHLDGLSDTFDAVMSWRPRERKLEIMRDSRVGAMGVLALVAVLLLKFAFLLSAGDSWWLAVLLAPLLGRWADIYGIYRFPAAREGGLGRSFNAQVQQRDLILASAVTVTALLLFGGLAGLVALLVVWAVAHLLARWWTRDLGGLTGDTYGALCEICEVIALAVLVL